MSEWGENVKHQGLDTEDMEFHHIIPLVVNGPNEYWNLIFLSKEVHIRIHEEMRKLFGKKLN